MPALEGPTHASIGGSPGCWQACGELLARQDEQPVPASAATLCVHASAVPHLGDPGRRAEHHDEARALAAALHD